MISGPAIAVACSRISTEAGTTILAIESVAKDEHQLPVLRGATRSLTSDKAVVIRLRASALPCRPGRASALLERGQPYFVGNNPENVAAASEFGFQAIRADSAGLWTPPSGLRL